MQEFWIVAMVLGFLSFAVPYLAGYVLGFWAYALLWPLLVFVWNWLGDVADALDGGPPVFGVAVMIFFVLTCAVVAHLAIYLGVRYRRRGHGG